MQNILSGEGARTLARSRNSFGRTALHVAVLAQHEDIVAYLAQTYPELLRVGDNVRPSVNLRGEYKYYSLKHVTLFTNGL